MPPNAVLSWEYYYGDFTLQSVTDLSLANGWVNVAGTPAVNGIQCILTNGPITGNQFYRLKAR